MPPRYARTLLFRSAGKAKESATQRMTVLKISFLFAAILLVARSASAQIPGLDQFLLPIFAADAPGAYGTLWTTDLWLRNDTDMPALIYPLTTPERYPPPRSTTEPSFYKALPGEPQGIFIYVDQNQRADLHFNLRVRDVSRQLLTWGTELPVVSEHAFASRNLVLLNVPLETGFRVGLRIYESRSGGAGSALVRIFDDDVSGVPVVGIPPLVETTLALSAREPSIHWPGYAQILDLRGVLPQLSGVSRARIEIEPLGEATRIWAFVSVTSNETQQVTTITPQ